MTDQAQLPCCLPRLLVVCLFLASIGAQAADRQVVVNGKAVSGSALKELDSQDCRQIPDGSYRLDRSTGSWGPADRSKPQGRLGDGCAKARSAQRTARSINEREASQASEEKVPRREEPITGTSPLLRTPGSGTESR